MPVIFYHYYTRENPLAHIWYKYMFIGSDAYFSFIIPAVIALALGFRLPLGKKATVDQNPELYIRNVQRILQSKPTLGLTLIAIGVISGLIDFLAPSDLTQVFVLIDHLTFVGVFYVLYSPNKNKKYIVPAVITLMVGQAIVVGMFGELIFILACALVLILLGKRISFWKKTLVAVAGIVLIVLIQSVKTDYRQRAWIELGGADPAYYAVLIGERIADPSTIFEPNKLFFAAVRMNQGWLVSYTMFKVPHSFEFANGETIWQSIAATFVPRFLWPDKPEAGGKANIKRFWGTTLTGYSMNIGPFGEGYANFGIVGGVIYMFFYGLFFKFILHRLLKFAEKRPTIILWIPFLFYYSISVETDLLTTMGALVKGVFFTWAVFQAFRIALRLDL
jgi:hypothetical protein